LPKGAAEAFERALFEAADRFGWEVYAYVKMSNHFHICMETPEPNLSLGMNWLLGTWVVRNNQKIESMMLLLAAESNPLSMVSTFFRPPNRPIRITMIPVLAKHIGQKSCVSSMDTK